MLLLRLSSVFFVALLLLAAAACGGTDAGTTPAVSDQATAGDPGSARMESLEDMPLPRTGSLTGYISKGWNAGASDYWYMPSQNFYDYGRLGYFTPTGPGPALEQAAFAFYAFDISEEVDKEGIVFYWQAAHDYRDVWVGFANFTENTWDWLPMEQDWTVKAEFEVLSGGDDYILVCPVVFGEGMWILDHLTTGTKRYLDRPEIFNVYPRSGQPGESITLHASVDSDAPVSYSWDLSDIAFPRYFEGPEPEFELVSTPGTYPCELTVFVDGKVDSFSFGFTVGQEPTWQHIWAREQTVATGNAVADSAGNVYVAGSTRGLDGEYTKTGAVVISYDIRGTERWTQLYSASSYDYFNDALVTPVDEVVLVGATGIGENTGDVLVIKMDQAGSAIRALAIDGGGQDRGYAVAADSAGNLYVVASTDSWHQGGTAYYDILILKLDADLNPLWAAYYYSGTLSSRAGAEVCVSADAEYVTGAGNALIKLAPDGQLLEQKLWDGFEEQAAGLDCDAAGNLYVAGRERVEPYVGQEQAVLMKLDPLLDLVWARHWGRQDNINAYEGAYAVAVAHDGDSVYYTGSSELIDSLISNENLFLGHLTTDGEDIGYSIWTGFDTHQVDSRRYSEAGVSLSFTPSGYLLIGASATNAQAYWTAVNEPSLIHPGPNIVEAEGELHMLDLGQYITVTELGPETLAPFGEFYLQDVSIYFNSIGVIKLSP